MSGPSSGRVSRWLLLSGIVAIATAVRIAGLSATALWGDEYRSIDEATSHLGANLTSVLYPFVLRAFMGMGQSVEVLRLPAVLFGVAAVVATYLLARTLTDERTAAIAAVMRTRPIGALLAARIEHRRRARAREGRRCRGAPLAL